MIRKYFSLIILSFFIFVEMKPYGTMSKDMNILKGCNSSFSVDKKTLNLALIAKHFQNDPDNNFKCFLHCLYYNYNWMNADGEFLEEHMKLDLSESNLDKPSIEYLLEACTEINAEDKCEKAYEFTECFWTESENFQSSY